MKLGSQYGCGEQLNCLMFITLFSYFKTAACEHGEGLRATCVKQYRALTSDTRIGAD